MEPARAFKFWVDTLCSEMVELRVESGSSDAFEAWLLQKALGPVKLNFIYTRDPQDVWRTQAAINRSSHESRFYLIYVRNGRFTFDTAAAASAWERTSACSSIAPSRTISEAPEFAAGTSIQIPHRWLSSWIALPQERVGQVVTGRDAVGHGAAGDACGTGTEVG